MTIDIQTLIKQRPHLKDPIELYARWQHFQQETGLLLPSARSAMSSSDAGAYPQDRSEAVFRVFVETFDLPEDELAPLGMALEQGQLDFMQFPLGNLPSFPELAFSEEELASLLFLLSRPYFLALRESFVLDGSHWENGRCPLCSARPALGSIVEGPQRRLHCSFCGTTGPYRRFIGCPNCGTDNVSKLNTLLSDAEPGFRVATCDECMTYVKVVEDSITKKMTHDLADMASLPLDLVAQGKGFSRLAP
ncbi:MAG: formate dehydrogenase accessory protein FdhE, partial [Desulfofustis sp.]|nr:formate dehydrogenase accessory protein FdhE [Desulfofustis sp.]